MKCPKCNLNLVKGKDQEFETLCDHVSNPNKESYPLRPTYICVNTNCECSNPDVFWDDQGDYYGGFKIKFDNDLYSAYPSLARKLDIEIYKKGLKKKMYLHPCFMLWFLKPMIEYNYKSNDSGNVLKKSYSLKWLKKDSWKPWIKDKFGYHTYYTFPIMMIYRHIKREYRYLDGSDAYQEYHFKNEAFVPLDSWDKRWWRHTELFLTKVLFYNQYKKYK